jgi:ABC-type bacteriocin/lantibiotic exporter with double-glycine peptidase domain
MENTKEFWQQHHKFQEENGWCGVACIQMALASAEIDVSQKEIAHYTYKDWWGAPQQLVLAYLSKYFRRVNYKHSATIRDISFHLNSNHIAMVNFWDNFANSKDGDGHYAIVAECKKGLITLADPSGERTGIWSTTTKDFKPHWYDTIETQNKLYIAGWLLWIDSESRVVNETK